LSRITDTITELDALVKHTCQLWEPGWVAYNWRGYTYDHIQRVRGLAVTLAEREAADCETVETAALLHDVTKPYDGDYLTDSQGKRLVDGDGYWISATREPVGQNEVTLLYDRLALRGQVHSRSAAAVAWHLLRKRGVGHDVRNRVAEAVQEHLGPSSDASIEARCLYDADLIDANIGLPAFIRHIYIHRHFYDTRRAPGQSAFHALMESAARNYLEPYVREALSRWIEGKERDFPPQLRTEAGLGIAHERLLRIRLVARDLTLELEDWDAGVRYGSLAVMLYLLGRSDDPSIAEEVAVLSNGWQDRYNTYPHTSEFITALALETAGLA